MQTRIVLVALTTVFFLAAGALALAPFGAWAMKPPAKTAKKHHKKFSPAALTKPKARIAASKAPPGQAARLAARKKLKASQPRTTTRSNHAAPKKPAAPAKAALPPVEKKPLAPVAKKSDTPAKPVAKSAPPKVTAPADQPSRARANLFDITN